MAPMPLSAVEIPADDGIAPGADDSMTRCAGTKHGSLREAMFERPERLRAVERYRAERALAGEQQERPGTR